VQLTAAQALRGFRVFCMWGGTPPHAPPAVCSRFIIHPLHMPLFLFIAACTLVAACCT
jgi:hypothetical protein